MGPIESFNDFRIIIAGDTFIPRELGQIKDLILPAQKELKKKQAGQLDDDHFN
jgi:hypothetical protein